MSADGQLAFSKLKLKPKLPPRSEYHLGGGITLTNSCSPQRLEDLPFGVRYDTTKQTVGLKNNILLSSLSGLEILRLEKMGYSNPRYVTTRSGLKIFTLYDDNHSEMRETGFVERNGMLLYTEPNGLTYVPTFYFVMLLVCVKSAFPLVIRKASFRELSERPTDMPLKLNSEFYSVSELFDFLQEDSLLEGVTSNANNGSESSSTELDYKYKPQDGISERCQPCFDAVAEKSSSFLSEDHFSLLAKTSTTAVDWVKSLAIMPFGVTHAMTFVCVIAAILVLRQIVRCIVLTVNFWVGVVSGAFIYNEYQGKIKYTPQSGIDGEYCKLVGKLLTLAGTITTSLVAFVRASVLLREHKAISYRPQSGDQGCETPQEASPPVATEPTVSSSVQKPLASRLSESEIMRQVRDQTFRDISRWQSNPTKYPLPRDILNRGVAFDAITRATLSDALKYKPVKQCSLGFGSGL